MGSNGVAALVARLVHCRFKDGVVAYFQTLIDIMAMPKSGGQVVCERFVKEATSAPAHHMGRFNAKAQQTLVKYLDVLRSLLDLAVSSDVCSPLVLSHGCTLLAELLGPPAPVRST